MREVFFFNFINMRRVGVRFVSEWVLLYELWVGFLEAVKRYNVWLYKWRISEVYKSCEYVC